MSKKLEIFVQSDASGRIISGKKNLQRAFEIFAGKRFTVVLDVLRKRRSGQQNRFFHGILLPLVSERLIEMGFNEAKSLEWTKDFVKYNCLLRECVSKTTGEVIKSLGQTSELTTTEFIEFIADIQQWAAERLDLYIPEPGEQGVFKMD